MKTTRGQFYSNNAQLLYKQAVEQKKLAHAWGLLCACKLSNYYPEALKTILIQTYVEKANLKG
jgi:hypothetical protein